MSVRPDINKIWLESKRLAAEHRSTIHRAGTAACVTLLAYLLSISLIQPFTFSAASLTNFAEKRDFNMTDLYRTVADSRPVSELDTAVVIVDIAFTDRADVIDVLETLSGFSPAAIGLDVTFEEKRAGDDRLIAALDSCSNLVMAIGVAQAGDGNSGLFYPDDCSYFYTEDVPTYLTGAVNLPSKYAGATIREFRKEYPREDGDTIPSMALALAELTDPAAAAEAKRRRNELEIIDYPSRQFTIIPWYELEDRGDDVAGKTVLIGALGELGDTHHTPIDENMDGVRIHALALSTILRRAWFSTVPIYITAGLGFMLCFILCFCSLSEKKSKAFSMWIRIIQLFLLYIIIQLGYWLYIDFNIIFDFSYALAMVVFGFFALDIWNGAVYYVNKYIIKNDKNEKTTDTAACGTCAKH